MIVIINLIFFFYSNSFKIQLNRIKNILCRTYTFIFMIVKILELNKKNEIIQLKSYLIFKNCLNLSTIKICLPINCGI